MRRAACGSRRDHQCLGKTGHAFEDAVAPAEERDEQLLDDLVLADDHLGHLVLDLVEGVAQLADRVEIVLAEVFIHGVLGGVHDFGGECRVAH